MPHAIWFVLTIIPASLAYLLGLMVIWPTRQQGDFYGATRSRWFEALQTSVLMIFVGTNGLIAVANSLSQSHPQLFAPVYIILMLSYVGAAILLGWIAHNQRRWQMYTLASVYMAVVLGLIYMGHG